MLIDPVFHLALRAMLLLLFLAALAHKLADVRRFGGTVSAYLIGLGLPTIRPSGPVAVLVIAAEALVVLALLFAEAAWLAAAGSAVLLLAYGAVMAINIYRGNKLADCGCSWMAGGQPVSYALAWRNLVLGAVSAALAVPVGWRALGMGDLSNVAAAAAIGALMYLSANRLLANLEPLPGAMK